MPTYRIGEILSFNNDATCTVSLDGALSSASNMDINISPTLLNVPFDYMDCGRAAFDDGDRVVVRFNGQDWDSPEVIGFESNPKGCNSFVITPSSDSGPFGGNVLVYPAGEGVEPSIVSGDDLPFAIAYERFGAHSKFSHDTKPCHISSQSKVPYIKGSPVFAGNYNYAVFAVVGGRYIIVDREFVYSVGLDGTTSAPYDPATNPGGYAHIGTLPYHTHIYIRPDGGKIYGFDEIGYCSATISDDGFSLSIGISVDHVISEGKTSTVVESGDSAQHPAVAGSSGTQTKVATSEQSYTGPIGVFWVGSPGAWVEQIVTATSNYTSETTTTCSWFESGGFYDGTTTVIGASARTLDIDAGGAYSKQITNHTASTNWNNTFSGALGWGDNPHPLGDVYDKTQVVAHESNMPRFLGGKDYLEETNVTSWTTTETVTGAYPHNFNYIANVNFKGNTSTHDGVSIASSPDLSSSYNGSWTSIDAADRPPPVSGLWLDYYEFRDEGAYSPVVYGLYSIYDIVLKNSIDTRIAETATKFMIADIPTGVEVTLLGSSQGENSTVGPYLSSYGVLDVLLGLGANSTGGVATIY